MFGVVQQDDVCIVSILDHSCQPNCVVSFSGPRLTVRAVAAVARLGEARISYLDPQLNTAARQARLLDNYYFR